MVNCPNCNSQNSPGSRFCINCGQTLSGQPESSGVKQLPYTKMHRRQLWEATARLLITLILTWLLRSILVNLSFIEALVIPDFPFSAEQIISFIFYVIVFWLLIKYTQTIQIHWEPVFPHLASLTQPLVITVYVILLSLAYRALLPIIVTLVDDPVDLLLVLRVILAILAIILLSWVGKSIYDALPGWLSRLRFESPPDQKACSNCGRLNNVSMNYCGYCGQSFSAEVETAAE